MKKVISFILCFVMLLSLASCGSKDANQPNTPSANQTDGTGDPAPEGKPTESVAPKFTLSEYLASGETIWYLLEKDKGKDSVVKRIFVIQPDGTLYTTKKVTHTLGELEQMDDADIVAMVKTEHVNDVLRKAGRLGYFVGMDEETAAEELKSYIIANNILSSISGWEDIQTTVQNILNISVAEEDRETYREPVTNVLTTWQSFVKKHKDVDLEFYISMFYMTEEERSAFIAQFPDTFPEELLEEVESIPAMLLELGKLSYQGVIARIEALKETANIQPFPYKLAIVTDSTGNSTSRIDLVYKETRIDGDAWVDDVPLTYIRPMFSPDDQKNEKHGNCDMVVYDSLYGGYYSDGNYFVTRVSENIHFKLDAVGTNDLPIDVKDYKTLFE